jgi:hypothetical protein
MPLYPRTVSVQSWRQAKDCRLYRVRDSFTNATDADQDCISDGSPNKGLRAMVSSFDVAANGVSQLLCRACTPRGICFSVSAESQQPTRLSQEGLVRVKCTRKRGWAQPTMNQQRLVRRLVVQDRVHIQRRGTAGRIAHHLVSVRGVSVNSHRKHATLRLTLCAASRERVREARYTRPYPAIRSRW